MSVPGLVISVCVAIWIVIGGVACIVIYDRFFGECSHAPKSVEFHQGMTLCPGQSAVFKLQ